MYKARFTLSQIINSGYLDNYLTPQIVRTRFNKTKSKNINVSVRMSSLQEIVKRLIAQCIIPIEPKAKVNSAGTDILVKVSNLSTSYSAIIEMLRNNKATISKALTHNEELETALEEELSKKIKGKSGDKLYLRLAKLEDIKGMTPREINALIDNIVENIYFNDAFSKTQELLGLRGKNNRDMFFTTRNGIERKGYNTMKQMWERKVNYE